MGTKVAHGNRNDRDRGSCGHGRCGPAILLEMAGVKELLPFEPNDARFVDPEALLRRVIDAAEDEDIEVRFSVGEVFAEKTDETIRNLYIRPIEAATTTPNGGEQAGR